MKIYEYCGPRDISRYYSSSPPGQEVRSPENVRTWVNETRQVLDQGTVIATFVIDQKGILRIVDRRSEHVACAGGIGVQSAGEITFDLNDSLEVIEITNQSTGYCPEPESWAAVESALSKAGIPNPGGFTIKFVFRKCEKCGQRNIVKEDIYECSVCEAPLPKHYNFTTNQEIG